MGILVTGAAGFIGYHVSKQLIDKGEVVVGIDNLNDYYDVNLKKSRLKILMGSSRFSFFGQNLADQVKTAEIFNQSDPQYVVHLAAQPGVRYSLTNPHAYVESNLVSFVNILEGCRHNSVQHFVYASSSSVYGANKKLPFSVTDNVDHPISLYAATKKSNELMAHTYSHLYGIPTTGLRFFTVYGPWGRPDMSYYLFTKAILEGKPINVFNNGKMKRDFTYIDDIVTSVIKTIYIIPQPNDVGGEINSQDADNQTSAPYKIFNIGNHKSIELMYFIQVIENCLGKKADLNMQPMQPGDVENTYADVSALKRHVDFSPNTPIEEGIDAFVKWYHEYHRP